MGDQSRPLFVRRYCRRPIPRLHFGFHIRWYGGAVVRWCGRIGAARLANGKRHTEPKFDVPFHRFTVLPRHRSSARSDDILSAGNDDELIATIPAPAALVMLLAD